MTLLKAVVVCLLVANAAYFLWARGAGGSEGPPAPIASSGSLRLASEDPGRASAGEAHGSGVPAAAAAGSGGALDAPGDNGARQALLSNVRRCITVGPFREVSEAAHAAATLRSGGYDPRQRVAEGEVWAGVWVYIPLAPGRGAAEPVLARLKSGGIEDAMEMPGPGDAGVVSLGLYVEPKRAQARVAQAQALGLNPSISDRKRNGNVYWIDIDLKPTDSLLKPADLQGESNRIMRLEVKACPGSS